MSDWLLWSDAFSVDCGCQGFLNRHVFLVLRLFQCILSADHDMQYRRKLLVPPFIVAQAAAGDYACGSDAQSGCAVLFQIL